MITGISSTNNASPWSTWSNRHVQIRGENDDGRRNHGPDRSTVEAKNEERSKSTNGHDSAKELTSVEEEQVRELKIRDAEVRAHESAHLAAAGSHARGGPVYQYQNGPDRNRYAVGGHVNIDTGEESTPKETVRKMQIVIAAATAPAEPSGKDLSVASQARQKLTKASQEVSAESAERQETDSDENRKDSGDDSEPVSVSDRNRRRILVRYEPTQSSETGQFIRKSA